MEGSGGQWRVVMVIVVVVIVVEMIMMMMVVVTVVTVVIMVMVIMVMMVMVVMAVGECSRRKITHLSHVLFGEITVRRGERLAHAHDQVAREPTVLGVAWAGAAHVVW